MKYRYRSQELARIFRALHRQKMVRITTPNRRVVGALRKLEKELKRNGYDFDVVFDSYKKELLVFSYCVRGVTKNYVHFQKFV